MPLKFDNLLKTMIKKVKVMFWWIISHLLLIEFAFWATRPLWNSAIKEWLKTISEDNVLDDNSDNGLTLLWNIFVWIKDSISSLVLLVAVAVFLYIWAKLAMARWNPEEFKKAMLQLIYAVVWIFIVGLAWAMVILVAWINL